MGDLRFIRSTTGRVHVLPDDAHECSAEPIASGHDFAAIMLAPTRMLCGSVFSIDWTGGQGRRAQPVGDFADEDLCARCVMAMGDQASEIFDRDAAWR
ncbi:hypothetical protein ACFY4C_21110 [Actinomadura viridis]|uniref:hypothetical protein n=1 Tax=Actinomadura viridis TaxID=58110 RepID=UPI0036B58E22